MRRRRVCRFVPRLENLETRSLLSALPLAAAPPDLPTDAAARVLLHKIHLGRHVAEGTDNGQLDLLAVADPADASAAGDAVISLYNYSAKGGLVAGGTVTTDLPAGPDLRVALSAVIQEQEQGFGHDLDVVAPDGKGSVIVEVFTGSQDSTGLWQFTPAGKYDLAMSSWGGNTAGGQAREVFRQDFGQVKADRRTEVLMVKDVNGDGTPDIVLTTATQVGVLLATAATNGQAGVQYTALPVVASPFLAAQASGHQGGVAATANVARQSTDVIVPDMNGGQGDDLLTELDGKVLSAAMSVTSAGISFSPVNSIDLLASGTDQPTPWNGHSGGATADRNVGPLKWMAPELFATSNADGTTDLVAIVGNHVFVGIGSKTTTVSNGTVATKLSFTWHVDTVPTLAAVELRGGAGAIFVADVDGDGLLDLAFIDQPSATQLGVTLAVDNIFGSS